MKRALIATLAFTMLATVAAANENHGGNSGSMRSHSASSTIHGLLTRRRTKPSAIKAR